MQGEHDGVEPMQESPCDRKAVLSGLSSPSKQMDPSSTPTPGVPGTDRAPAGVEAPGRGVLNLGRKRPRPRVNDDSTRRVSPKRARTMRASPGRAAAGGALSVNTRPLDVVCGYPSELEAMRLKSAEYERLGRLSARGLDAHPRLNIKMRTIVVSWLMEVGAEFGLSTSTVYTGIALLDMYLARTTAVARSRLQLWGIVSLFIAAKTEEVYPPTLTQFVDITDKAYTAAEMKAAEIQLLETVQWRVHPPVPPLFAAHFLTAVAAAASGSPGSPPHPATIPGHHPAWAAVMALINAAVLDLAVTETFTPELLAAAAVYLVACKADNPADAAALFGLPRASDLVSAAQCLVVYADETVLAMLPSLPKLDAPLPPPTAPAPLHGDAARPLHSPGVPQIFARPDLARVLAMQRARLAAERKARTQRATAS